LTPKWGEVTEECRKMLNEELHNVYSSSDIIRMIKTHTGTEKNNAYRALIRVPEGKRPLGRP
jgi:hypothetical protein